MPPKKPTANHSRSGTQKPTTTTTLASQTKPSTKPTPTAPSDPKHDYARVRAQYEKQKEVYLAKQQNIHATTTATDPEPTPSRPNPESVSASTTIQPKTVSMSRWYKSQGGKTRENLQEKLLQVKEADKEYHFGAKPIETAYKPSAEALAYGIYTPSPLFHKIAQAVDEFQSQKAPMALIQNDPLPYEHFITRLEPLLTELLLEQNLHSTFKTDLKLLRMTLEELPGMFTQKELTRRSAHLVKLYQQRDEIETKLAQRAVEKANKATSADGQNGQPQQTTTSSPTPTTTEIKPTKDNPFSLDQTQFKAFADWLNAATHDQMSQLFKDYKNQSSSGFGLTIDLKTGFKEGTGLVALKDIQVGQTVMSIPRAAMMSTELLHHHPHYKSLLIMAPRFGHLVDQSFGLALMVAIERYLGEQSLYNPYLNLLPNHVPCVATATADDLLILRNSPHYFTALRSFITFVSQYLRITFMTYQFNQLIDSNIQARKFVETKQTQKIKSLFPAPDTTKGYQFVRPISFLIFRWAISIVMSRQNPIPQSSGQGELFALIPGFDFANFSIPDDPALQQINTEYCFDTECCETYGMAPIKAGEQFYMYYGKRPAIQFTLYQGFLPQHDSLSQKVGGNSYFDTTAISITKPNDPHSDLRLSILERLGLDSACTLIPFREHLPSVTPQSNDYFGTKSSQPETTTDQTGQNPQPPKSHQQVPQSSPLKGVTHEQWLNLTWTRVWKTYFILSLNLPQLITILRRIDSCPNSDYSAQFSQEENEATGVKLLLADEVIPNTALNMKFAIDNEILPRLYDMLLAACDEHEIAYEIAHAAAGVGTDDEPQQRFTETGVLFANYRQEELRNIQTQIKAIKALRTELDTIGDVADDDVIGVRGGKQNDGDDDADEEPDEDQLVKNAQHQVYNPQAIRAKKGAKGQ